MPSAGLTLVSGGQTGVDRAALDVALELGMPCGGWVPKGRRAQDGPLDVRYPLREADRPEYAVRTRLNVRDSDATLIVTRGVPTGGTALTLQIARELGRPVLVADLDRELDAAEVSAWIAKERIAVLNVAGPRESTVPGIHDDAMTFFRRVFG